VDAIAQALVSVFDQADIVALGEEHEWQPDSDVRIALVRHPDFAKKVRFIVVEFGRNSRQSTLDRYIRGENVPRAQLEQVWKTTQVGAVSPIYPAFFAAVRDVNLKLPADARIRVFGAEGAPGLSGEKTAVTFLKQQVLQKHGKALVIYGYAHFWRAEPEMMRGRSGGVESGIVSMLEKDYPGRTVAVMPVGRPKRPSPPGSPKGSVDPDYGKFDRSLKTPARPVLLSLQRSPFRDFSAEEFLGNDVFVCGGPRDVPKQPKGKNPSAIVKPSGPCVSVFQGSTLTLGQMADAVVYFGAEANVAPKAKPVRSTRRK
jgi:hypothetical protein